MREDEDEPKKLKMVKMQGFGSSMMTLYDSGPVPDVMSVRLCDLLHVVPIEKKRRITMTDSREAVVAGEISRVPVMSGHSTAEISCPVVRPSPYDLIIGRPTVKKVRASLDSDRNIATFRHEGENRSIALITKKIEGCAPVRNELTSDNSDGVSSEKV